MVFKRKAEKGCRIAIIGAGSAGLSAAEALKKKGYKNVTVFERSGRAGGQALSMRYTAPDHRDGVYEMGSICPISSKILYRLLKEYGLHLGKSTLIHSNINKKNTVLSRIYSENQKEYIIDFTKYKTGFPANRTIDWLFDMAKLLKLLFRYRALIKPGLAHISDDLLEELSISYDDWIKKANFRILSIALESTIGNIATLADDESKKTVSALICIKFIFQTLHYPFRYSNGSLRLVKEGYQELWNRVAQNNAVLFKAHIQKIVRENNTIDIHLLDGQKYTFDKLIVTCSPTQALHILDCTDAEKYIFEKVKYSSGWRVAFTAKNLFHDSVIVTAEPYYKFNHKPTLVVFYPEMQIDSETWLYTGFVTCSKKKELEAYLHEIEAYLSSNFSDVGKQGEITQWVDTAFWNEYCPHFDLEETRNGIYRKYEALQGINNTYYLGGAISMSSQATILDYSYKRINDFF